MNIAYLGLGSNLSDPARQIKAAIVQIDDSVAIKVSAISSLYFSRPMGPQDQPDYMNAVIEIETTLKPIALLEQLQTIENKAGRVRKENRWGARILDIDILLYNNDIIETARLTVPHYGMKEREFVLIPLAEINHELTLPDGQSVADLARHIAANGLEIHSQLCK